MRRLDLVWIPLLLFTAACNSEEPAATADAADSDATFPPAPDAAVTGDAHEVADAAVASCTGLESQPLDSVWTLESGGRTRSFQVHVPESYDPATPMPLVFDLHGLAMDSDQQIWLSHMNEFADDHGFVAVHPDGIGNSWNAGGCCGTASSSDVDDVGFVSDMIDSLSSELCIDASRVFATGMSNGGHMSYRLGCDLADRITAVAPVAGTNTTDSCSPSRPVPLIHFHGTADLVVPYNGNLTESLPPVVETTTAWAVRNGCSETRTEVFANGDSVCEEFDDCPLGGQVTLCTVDGGGHTWPGGSPMVGLGTTTDDLSATAAMWEFWMEQPPLSH